MKLLGFIKEYNNIEDSIPLSKVTNTKTLGSLSYIGNILSYLDKGALVFGWMGYFVDVGTGEPIAPDSYFTDGLWVWPSYLPYYLNKYSYGWLNREFVEYLMGKEFQFCVEEDFESRASKMENDLILVLNSSAPTNT